MDYTDYKIIETLQNDGRISMKDLAKLVALSPPATAERVRRLEESGIIQRYKAIIDTIKIGKPIRVFINVAMKSDKLTEFVSFAENMEEIIECYHVTGPYSMIIKAHLKEMSNLESLVGKVQAFGNTETHIIMSSPIENKPI
ncbi:Lrp/AsnC family transcriptional regulator, leucine-responsive regulatory protein [Dethiosulfatibacter aminovorans DSM 17477]|uniref:Lrp/AsnC family transcriptional regulator, leucine-responsive regulatory protein n=1 Tax=Dethiosulfatibacter aminovorans DSM 17477 TaxID=1121476 RepID=A0A1M6G0W5_9FIRM|nr:Lrp/AsnC family transcriptional regulator [Dethiosulfatibacter aminovorans]SHJ03583.1 Lrp/AsnC family transcriptional regulator, leucine-responsive regulatory protein [Dethiosulfatibacter aminovorans DSM 17477]